MSDRTGSGTQGSEEMEVTGPMRFDIVSDVVCPWCIVGYRQLQKALANTEMPQGYEVHWHPFELNPQMPPEGQDLREHVAEKYGSTKEQSLAARKRLKDIGAQLDFQFAYNDTSKMVNTFKAHQLLHWAGLTEQESPLKEALFEAYFTDQKDISKDDVLLNIVEPLGLDRTEAAQLLKNNTYADAVRQRQSFWHQQGIRSVPTLVINQRYVVTGAQGVETYERIIKQINEEPRPE